MNMKSDTCFGKSGSPLSVFVTELEAQSSADYERGQWHLAPEESRVDFRENACSCTDSHGNGKRLYATREDAEKALETSEEARGVRVRAGNPVFYAEIFPCN